jgi:hypothetical protein
MRNHLGLQRFWILVWDMVPPSFTKVKSHITNGSLVKNISVKYHLEKEFLRDQGDSGTAKSSRKETLWEIDRE